MELQREFFPKVRKTIMPRPYFSEKKDILGQSGTAWAGEAAIYGDNWCLHREQGLIEIYGAGAAISFHHLLPAKNKYEKEGLYLRLRLAYRTTAHANANLRTFSGNHVTLPNSLDGNMYDDPENYWWLTDDLTLNINSIYSGEKLWIQRVDWEWMSKEVVYEDEVHTQALFLERKLADIEQLYHPDGIDDASIKKFLIQKIQGDESFAKRCLMLLAQENMKTKELTQIFQDSGFDSASLS